MSQECPQTTTFLKRKESGIEPRSFRLPAERLTARPNRNVLMGGFTMIRNEYPRGATLCWMSVAEKNRKATPVIAVLPIGFSPFYRLQFHSELTRCDLPGQQNPDTPMKRGQNQ